MKYCPECRRGYADETLNFCLDDGSRLVLDGGESATAIMSVSGSSSLPSGSFQQDIQFAQTEDGVRIAYSVIGSGPMLVRVLGHFTHLEMEWQWPDLRHLWERLAERFTVVRYDGRGMGLSDKYDGEFTEGTRQLDLDAVLRAVDARQTTLFAISEGGWTAAEYTLEHGERVGRLIIYGGYSRGVSGRPDHDPEEDAAMMTLIRKGWGRDTPIFRQLFTANFLRPDADPKLLAHFNEMQRAAADPETAARYFESLHARGDGTEMYRQLNVPTLIIHCQEDLAVPADEGRRLASIIPGARLVLLPSGAHYFPTDRDVVDKIAAAITRFVDE